MYKNKHAVEGDFDAAKRAHTPILVLTWNNCLEHGQAF